MGSRAAALMGYCVRRYHQRLIATWTEMRFLHSRLEPTTLTKEECADWLTVAALRTA